MDDTDRRLIALLRDNGRLPVATLAHRLKVSRGTVQNRIDRLTADGVIGGFTVRLKPEAEPQRVRAITMVAVEGEHTAPVLKSLRGIPEVQALHTTNGRWDIAMWPSSAKTLRSRPGPQPKSRIVKGRSLSMCCNNAAMFWLTS